jgi:hypothetical protein
VWIFLINAVPLLSGEEELVVSDSMILVKLQVFVCLPSKEGIF